jgi:hypothetical protein
MMAFTSPEDLKTQNLPKAKVKIGRAIGGGRFPQTHLLSN